METPIALKAIKLKREVSRLVLHLIWLRFGRVTEKFLGVHETIIPDTLMSRCQTRQYITLCSTFYWLLLLSILIFSSVQINHSISLRNVISWRVASKIYCNVLYLIFKYFSKYFNHATFSQESQNGSTSNIRLVTFWFH